MRSAFLACRTELPCAREAVLPFLYFLVLSVPMEEITTKIYEVGYLVIPLLDAAAIESLAAKFKSGLTALGATITEEGAPKMTSLAYTLSRRISEKKFDFNDGYFGSFRYEIEPAKADAVKELFVREGQLLRHLIVALDRNALLAEKKQAEARAKRAAEKALEDAAAPAAEGVGEAAIDKEIDSLLA